MQPVAQVARPHFQQVLLGTSKLDRLILKRPALIAGLFFARILAAGEAHENKVIVIATHALPRLGGLKLLFEPRAYVKTISKTTVNTG